MSPRRKEVKGPPSGAGDTPASRVWLNRGEVLNSERHGEKRAADWKFSSSWLHGCGPTATSCEQLAASLSD